MRASQVALLMHFYLHSLISAGFEEPGSGQSGTQAKAFAWNTKNPKSGYRRRRAGEWVCSRNDAIFKTLEWEAISHFSDQSPDSMMLWMDLCWLVADAWWSTTINLYRTMCRSGWRSSIFRFIGQTSRQAGTQSPVTWKTWNAWAKMPSAKRLRYSKPGISTSWSWPFGNFSTPIKVSDSKKRKGGEALNWVPSRAHLSTSPMQNLSAVCDAWAIRPQPFRECLMTQKYWFVMKLSKKLVERKKRL